MLSTVRWKKKRICLDTWTILAQRKKSIPVDPLILLIKLYLYSESEIGYTLSYISCLSTDQQVLLCSSDDWDSLGTDITMTTVKLTK